MGVSKSIPSYKIWNMVVFIYSRKCDSCPFTCNNVCEHHKDSLYHRRRHRCEPINTQKCQANAFAWN
ncbi:hypothetical protein BLOT_007757 [Blomia tropicalis]|nr:hypothetical protein BLOT_007757 [Blomia tropicalis]